MTLRRIALLGLLLVLAGPATADVAWRDWNSATFERARAERKPVFLYLEAVWCHWCHVMQQTTLADPAVQAALRRDFIAVRVDHDANPGLANRYREYGWPALVFFAPDGTDLVKRSGYIAPENFRRLLGAIAADPTPEQESPEPSPPAPASALAEGLRRDLVAGELRTHDREAGGLDTVQKFLDRNSLEYALERAREGSAVHRGWALQTLDAGRALLDPVWGGIYQYSTGARWDRPHYEKIMRSQAGALRVYAQAFALERRDADRQAAQALIRYLNGFLRGPEGTYHVSQDADLVPGQKAHDYFALDDPARRARGLPRIDRRLHADANGMAIEALALYSRLAGDASAGADAVRAARWILANRARADGGFRHGERDAGGPWLGDSLWMARALLALHQLTGERHWLARAAAAAEFMDARFRAPGGGYTGTGAGADLLTPIADLDENIQAARLFALLAHYTGRPAHRAAAEHAMRWLAQETVARTPFEQAGILLADRALARDPAHLTVVGARGDATARALFEAAGRTAGTHLRLEWWDRAEGPLPNTDVQYPVFGRSAGYVCSAGRCSAPSFTPADYRRQIERLLASRGSE